MLCSSSLIFPEKAVWYVLIQQLMKIGYISLAFWGNARKCTETARTQRMSVQSGRMEMERTVFIIVWILSILCMLRYRLPCSI